jgi:hypothetical protein
MLGMISSATHSFLASPKEVYIRMLKSTVAVSRFFEALGENLTVELN